MTDQAGSFIVLGGTGLIGSAVAAWLAGRGHRVTSVNSAGYAAAVGASADALINCNGNTYRYKANQDPKWDFDASVQSVARSLFDFQAQTYVYISTIDVYNVLDDRERNQEAAQIDPRRLDSYGFHKWLAERLAERYAERAIIFRSGTAVGPGLKKGPLFDVLHQRPLFMSAESRLSLVHTADVARVVERAVFDSDVAGVYNLTGSGSVAVCELGEIAALPVTVEAKASGVVHRYDINNDKLCRLMPMPTSREVATRFFGEERRRRRPS
jgi:nucleoside-diphosphate-sugar epimerase